METLAQLSADAARQQALARGAALTLVVIGLGVVVLTILALYALARQRRALRRIGPPTPSKRLDAWAVAAQRVQYEKRADQYEDDDDDDLDDSTWEDTDSDDDDSSDGGPPTGGSPPKPPTGPSGPSAGPKKADDDDSFAGDDIPGKRLDF